MIKNLTHSCSAILSALLCIVSFSDLRASDATWSSTASSGDWAYGSNWVGAVSAGATGTTDNPDTATFSTGSSTLAIVPDTTRNIKNIAFSSSSVGAYTIGTTTGNAIRLSDGGSIQVASTVANTETLNAPLLLQGNYAITNSASNSARLLNLGGAISGTAAEAITNTLVIAGTNTGANTLSGIISDGAGGGKLALAKSGSGAWVLSGTNTFSGGTTLEQGTLYLNNNSAVGTGLFTIKGGKLVNSSGGGRGLTTANSQIWDGDFAFAGKSAQSDPKVSWNLSLGSGNVLLTGDRAIDVSGYASPNGYSWEAATLTVAGGISDGGSGSVLTKNGAGSLTMNGSNSFSGGITLNAGGLGIGHDFSLGTGPLTINGGTLVNTTNGVRTIANNNVQYWNGNFGVSLQIYGQMNMGTGSITLGNDVTISLGGSAYGQVFALSGVIGETGGSRKIIIASGSANPGTFFPRNGNTYSGGTVLNSAVIRIGHPQALGTGPLTVNGGSFSQTTNAPLIGVPSQTWAGDFALSCTAGPINLGSSPVALIGLRRINIDNGNAFVGGDISGSGAGLTIVGSQYTSSLTFRGTNTFDGGLTLTSGSASMTFNIGNASALGTGTLTLDGLGNTRFDNVVSNLTALTTNNPQNWKQNFTFVGSYSLNMGTGAVALNTNATVTVNANTLTIGGTITNGALPFVLTKAGAGTLAFSGINTYSGNTVVTGGTLSVESSGSLGTGSVIVSPGATLALKNSESLANNATVNLLKAGASYGKVNLATGVVERVGSVVYEGTTYNTPGMSFGSVGSGSTLENNNYFVGTGKLKITAPITTIVIVK